MKLAVTVAAVLALVVLDYFVLAVMFLYRPNGAEILAGIMLVGTMAAVLLRWRWLFVVSQNMVTAITVVRLLQWEGPGEARDLVGPLFFVLLLALGNALAWLVARAIPARRLGSQPR